MTFPSRGSRRAVAAGLCALLGLPAIAAQAAGSGASVVRIEVDRKPAMQHAGFYVTPPRGRRSPTTLQTGSRIAAGSTIETPSRTTLWLQTSNGNPVTIYPRGSTTLKLISPQGESFVVRAGRVGFKKLNKSLGFFTAGGPGKRYQGSARGTEFFVTVNDKKISFDVTEGRVDVQKPVQVRVAEPARGGATARGRKLETIRPVATVGAGANSGELDLDYYDQEFADFETFEAADLYFQEELQRRAASNEGLLVADDYMTLGHLSLDAGNPAGAAQHFQQALQIHRAQLAPYDPVLAENEEALGYAYLESGNPQAAFEQFRKALGIYEAIYPDEADPAFVISYVNLAIASDLGQQQAQAQQFMSKAITLAEQDAQFAEAYYQALVQERESGLVDPEEEWDAALDAADAYALLAELAEINRNPASSEYAQRAQSYEQVADATSFEGIDLLDDLGYGGDPGPSPPSYPVLEP